MGNKEKIYVSADAYGLGEKFASADLVAFIQPLDGCTALGDKVTDLCRSLRGAVPDFEELPGYFEINSNLIVPVKASDYQKIKDNRAYHVVEFYDVAEAMETLGMKKRVPEDQAVSAFF